MQKFFGGLRKFIAIICAVLFVVTTLLALLLYNVEKRAFNARVYKQALIEQDVYSRLPGLIGEGLVASMDYDLCADNPIACDAENRPPELEACLQDALGDQAYLALVWNERAPTEAELRRADPCFGEYGLPGSGPQKDGPPAFMKNLTAKDWEVLITALLPPEELEPLAEEALDQVFAYLNGETNSAQLSLTGIKRRLASEAGVDAVLQFLSAQPPCTPEDIANFTGFGGEGDFTYCNPPEEMMPRFKPILQDELDKAANDIPDKVMLIKPSPSNEMLANIQSIRLLMRMSPLLPMGLLFVITILVVRSLRGWLRWWGIPMLIAGALGMLVGWSTIPIFGFFFNVFMIDQIPPYVPSGLIEIGFELVSGVLHRLIEIIVLDALIIAILGLAMVVASTFVKPAGDTAQLDAPPQKAT